MSDIKESAIFPSLADQQSHWYYAAKINKIASLLNKTELPLRHLKCLDVGAGNGIMSHALASRLDSDGRSNSWHLVDSGYQEDELLAEDPQFVSLRTIPENQKYDIVLAIDVIEHINNQSQFLTLIHSHCKPGSVVIITAPALMFLWSNHDIFLEHFRRYCSKDLQHQCTASGFHVLAQGYIYSTLLPLVTFVIYLKKLLAIFRPYSFGQPRSNMKRIHPTTNNLLRFILSVEQAFKTNIPALNKIWGSTAFVLAKTI